MEKLSDVLSSVKERVTNPFLVSFAIFWCSYNWRIPVALISWDMQQIYATGSSSIFEFVQKELAVEGTFWIPFRYAAAYALLAPFVFSGVSIVGGWAIKFGNKFILKNSTTTPINFEKFMELKKKHKETSDDYAKLLTTENDTQKQLVKTTKDYNDALERNKIIQEEHEKTISILKAANTTEINRVSGEAASRITGLQNTIDQEREKNNRTHDTAIIAGRWLMTEANEDVYIQDRRFVINGQPDVINLFDCHDDTYIRFVVTKVNINQNDAKPFAIFFDLTKVSDDKLEGYMNGLPITFDKIKSNKVLVGRHALS